jgi:hypothetical protein
VPIALPSAALPSYTAVDPKSNWHVSALFATALESMTLPSRLKLQNSSRETIDELTSAININGNQNIAKLQMSIDQKEPTKDSSHQVLSSQGDMRAPSQERRGASNIVATTNDEPNSLDIGLFPSDGAQQSREQRNTKSSHIFGQAEYHRSDEDNPQKAISYADEGHERARRRAAGLPIVEKYEKPFSFLEISASCVIFANSGASRMLQPFAYSWWGFLVCCRSLSC